MIGVQLRPTDTLFFGSGAPFAAEGVQVDVQGVFPPYPATVVGAIRAWIARSQGWSGYGRWPIRLNAVLGDGPEELLALRFSGPYLLRDGERLFPMPASVVGTVEEHGGGSSRWSPSASLRPGDPVRCDLGAAVRLPALDRTQGSGQTGGHSRPKQGEGLWLTPAGFQAVLCGELPSSADVIEAKQLWQEERRVGIERDRASRSAKEGMLYSCRHVRLASNVGLGVCVAGLPDDWERELFRDRTLSLGGESRTVLCEPWSDALGSMISVGDQDAPVERVMLVSLTPMDLGTSIIPGMTLLQEQGGVRVISACAGRPLRIGGWSSLERRSLPLRTHIPAGTVIYAEALDPERLSAAYATSGGIVRVGAQQSWGFGEVALGAWTDKVKEER